jgi:hypothetical protein
VAAEIDFSDLLLMAHRSIAFSFFPLPPRVNTSLSPLLLLCNMSDEKQALLNATPATSNGYSVVQVDSYIAPSIRESLGLALHEYGMLFLGVCGALGMGATPLLFYYFFGDLIGQV